MIVITAAQLQKALEHLASVNEAFIVIAHCSNGAIKSVAVDLDGRLHAWAHDGDAVDGTSMILMSAEQMREAIDFAAPDGTEEQNETELTIAYCSDTNKAHSGAGLYAWLADYPEEGSIKLCDDLSGTKLPEHLEQSGTI